jgi:hypothetical protein
MSAGPMSPLGSEFNDFLFAPIGEDQNGLSLSVVSLLARMNMDPWEEAGNLATLPAQAARIRLALSLDSLTDPRLRQAICETTIPRLLPLLPRRPTVTIATPPLGGDELAKSQPDSHIRTIVLIAITTILAGAQMLAVQRFAPIQPRTGTCPEVLTVPSHTQPTGRAMRQQGEPTK